MKLPRLPTDRGWSGSAGRGVGVSSRCVADRAEETLAADQPNVKHERLGPGVEELDLEEPLDDRPGLTDQLVHPLPDRAPPTRRPRRRSRWRHPARRHRARPGTAPASRRLRPMTRFTSRAGNRNAIRPPGASEVEPRDVTVHSPASAHWFRARTRGGVDLSHVRHEARARRTRSPARTRVRLARPEVRPSRPAPLLPVRAARRGRARSSGARLGEELLDRPARSSRTRLHRSGGAGCVPARRRSTAPASSGSRTRARPRSRCRSRPAT